MRARSSSLSVVLTTVLLASVALAGCTAPAEAPAPSAHLRCRRSGGKGGQDEFGPYEVVANWPQPLPDGPDGVKHEGWTWGSTGAVYAETPDRIWIAMRGELPLPARREALDAVRHAQPNARQRHRQRRWARRHV